jgi:predicted RNase H-like HicB family nuclease
MSILTDSARSAVFRDGQIIIAMESGSEIRFPVAKNPRLAQGTAKQLSRIEISPFGIHWPDLDEDLSFRGLLAGDYGQHQKVEPSSRANSHQPSRVGRRRKAWASRGPVGARARWLSLTLIVSAWSVRWQHGSRDYPEFSMKTYTAIVEKCPETNLFVGHVPGFPGAHSQATTLDELSQNLQEVVAMLLEDGEPLMEAHFVGTQTIRVA